MRQWREAKAKHPDCLVMTRLGDFYEFFGSDAEEASRLLGITLTSRNNGSASRVPLAGVPAKAMEEYVQTLIRAGRRVAILEQVEDPALAKGVVKREVVETVTPGAVLSDAMLQAGRNNYLVAVIADGAGGYGLGAVDVSTGEITGILVSEDRLESELARLQPSEVLLSSELGDLCLPVLANVPTTVRPEWLFDAEVCREELKRRFNLRSLDGLGFAPGDGAIVGAVGALMAYVTEVQPEAAKAVRPPRVERPSEAMVLDEMTCRNLELVESLRQNQALRGVDPTLLGVLDETRTPMGARLVRRWLLRPLVSLGQINRRLDAVGELATKSGIRSRLRAELRDVRDLERLTTKVSAGRVTPRELRALGDSLARLPAVIASLGDCESPLLEEMKGLDSLPELTDLLLGALVDEPPATLADGGTIRENYDSELDRLRETRDGAVQFIAGLQNRERERTGISSLKIGYNQVFGYYIEATKTNLDKVPADWIRKQTIANGERYITPELKDWESKALGAGEKVAAREAQLFAALRDAAGAEADRLRASAETIATLDVLAAFAQVADLNGYTRPHVHEGYRLQIRQGRHPVVERMMPREQFIPNDVVLDHDCRILTITGPNAGGKSTILRQVGLIQLMAQVGSFVPAASAELPIVDRIFTRVGASDNLAAGQSTYTVEVTETALILNSATERSLVLLDEIGRGTATYDGVSIAWAVTEHVHDAIRAKTIFATHYHEITQLEELLPALRNANVAAVEAGDRVVFMYRLCPGGANRSYGIEVARMSGIPATVIRRARQILAKLEKSHSLAPRPDHGPAASALPQLTLFPREPHPVVEKLGSIEIEKITPLEALNVLAALRAEAVAGG